MISSFLNVGTEAANDHSPRPYSAHFYRAPLPSKSPSRTANDRLPKRPGIPGGKTLLNLHWLVYQKVTSPVKKNVVFFAVVAESGIK
jgi:hypothetical protein